jgi:hypothetical protein
MEGDDAKKPRGHPLTGNAGSKSKIRREATRSARAQLDAEARERCLRLARVELTPELVDQIVECIPTGNYPGVIAQSLGITPSTFRTWMDAGRARWETRDAPETMLTSPADPLGLRVELYIRVSRAEAEWEADLVEDMVGRIDDNRQWAGHMTMLQRRKPERWEARGRTESSVGDRTWESELAEIEAARARRQISPDGE